MITSELGDMKFKYLPLIIFFSLPLTLLITWVIEYDIAGSCILGAGIAGTSLLMGHLHRAPQVKCKSPTQITVTFPLAFYHKHVTYMVPYISDSGALPPESCIFGQGLNIICILIALAMYIKYRQVIEILNMINGRTIYYTINATALYIGLAAVFGISLVANFQETIMLTVHVLGAFMCFGFGAVYQCLQTYLYFKMSDVVGVQFENIFRLILSVVSSISYITFAVYAVISVRLYDGDTFQNWKKEDKGFQLHIISTISEWICASCTLVYLYMFTKDFACVDMKEPNVIIRDDSIGHMSTRRVFKLTTEDIKI